MGPWNKTPEERERIRTSVRAAGQKRRDDFVDRNPNRPSVQQRRMHHHDKHAATKDGHRPDDPHGVTNNPLTNRWKAEQVRFQDIDPDTEPDWKQQQLDDLMTNQIAIQAVLDEPNIRREGHEVFDESVNYDQRVTAFGDIERDLSGIDSSSGSDQLEAEMGRGEGFDDGDDPGFIKDPSNAYARKATFAQDYPTPPPPPPPTSSKSSEPTGPPLSKWEQDYASVRNKVNASKIQQWRRGRAGDKAVSERLGLKDPERPAPRVVGEKRSGPPAPTSLMPRSAPPPPPR